MREVEREGERIRWQQGSALRVSVFRVFGPELGVDDSGFDTFVCFTVRSTCGARAASFVPFSASIEGNPSVRF